MISLLFLTLSCFGSSFNLIPGKSLGSASLNETVKDLKAKGFQKDDARAGDEYLKKGLLLVRVNKGQSAQIIFEGKDLSQVSLRGKAFPKSHDKDALTGFLRGCEPESEFGGGILIYCEKRGVELAFSKDHKFQGLSVVNPAYAQKMMGDNAAP